MNLRLASGSVEPGEAAEEQVRGVHMDERDVVMVAEQADDLLGLVRAHQPVIDEDAGQLVADRLVDQHRGDRAVDAAGKAADHPALADLGADVGDLGGADIRPSSSRRRRPQTWRTKLASSLPPSGVWTTSGWNIRLKKRRCLVGRDRIRRAFGCGDDAEALGQRLDPVAMAHPDLVALARLPEPVEQRGFADDLDEGAAELAIVGRRDPAAQLLRHRLLAVADGEDRQAGVEEMLRRARAVVPHHRGGAAGKDDALGLQPREGLVGAVERRDLAIDAGLAHPPGDELGHLAAEIDDEDGIGAGRHGRAIGRGRRAVKLSKMVKFILRCRGARG